MDLYYADNDYVKYDLKKWQEAFAFGLRQAVSSAIDTAAGRAVSIAMDAKKMGITYLIPFFCDFRLTVVRESSTLNTWKADSLLNNLKG